jgi:hypothetical protein
MAVPPRKNEPLHPAFRRDLPRPGGRRAEKEAKVAKRQQLIARAKTAGIALAVVALLGTVAYLFWPQARDPRLYGAWQSDANATITEMRKHRTLSATEEKEFRAMFGRKLTYEAGSVTIEGGDKGGTQPYRVMSKDQDSVVIRMRLPGSDLDEQFKVQFADADTHWLFMERLGLKECFRRAK